MPEGTKDESLCDGVVVNVQVVCRLKRIRSKSTIFVFFGTYLLMQISSKVGRRGQGLVVLKGCRARKSFRYGGKVNKSVLDVLLFSSESSFGWAVQTYILQALCNLQMLRMSLRALDKVGHF